MADANTDPTKLKHDLWQKMADSPFVMVGPADGSAHSEPLTAQLDEDQVDTLFFFVGKDNRLAGGGRVMAQYVSKGHDFFACMDGQARIDNDPALIDKLWNKQAEAWFPGGREDPNLALLRVDVDSAELWESDISLSGRVKMLFGGTIKASESGSHAKVATTAENSPA
ncbi:pyridoxamine 5'-phosphate oxidase family protein [Sphingomonas sp. BK580]|uniref:pyridoxamine 5'-phosphate oxidase family protein n=1 Tax=Sphingomonas sp. BK580 TaxID=2586972 RepID=UPI00161E0943|nr:pyridoxamine 5'-phosphate oxidase family protein [Sphingomonas sp. BK580]MBB3695296.1 general stress protein 26 [Sphingomonas sp. BK580]